MTDSITFRDGKPAIDVKDRRTYHNATPELRAIFDALPESIVQRCYEQAQETFWRMDAPSTAKAYGYGDVYAEGRSGGWLMVDNPPILDPAELDDCEPAEAQKRASANCEKWEEFEIEIETAIKGGRAHFEELLREALGEWDASERRRLATQAMSVETLRLLAIEAISKDRLPRRELDRIVLDYGDPCGDADEEDCEMCDGSGDDRNSNDDCPRCSGSGLEPNNTTGVEP